MHDGLDGGSAREVRGHGTFRAYALQAVRRGGAQLAGQPQRGRGYHGMAS